MKNQILKLGKTLNKYEQQQVVGGERPIPCGIVSCSPSQCCIRPNVCVTLPMHTACGRRNGDWADS